MIKRKKSYLNWMVGFIIMVIVSQFSYANVSTDTMSIALEKCASTNFKDKEAINKIFTLLDITSKEHEDIFLRKISAVAKSRGLDSTIFGNKLRNILDQKRFEKVNNLLKQVYKQYGKGLDVVVRTGSSGYRHMELTSKRTDHAGYRLLFSDDDISFVGEEAVGAAKYFNELLKNNGLEKLKVKGFDIVNLKNVRNIDLNFLNLLESEKFVGESAMAGIKKEMLDKGVVIAEKQGSALVVHTETLSSFVKNKVDNMLANELSEKAIRGIVQKRGAMTMIGSCERQITGAHGGWQELSNPEKVKYVLRQRIALDESGALRDLKGMTPSKISDQLEYLKKLKMKKKLTKGNLKWLQKLRAQNIELAFEEIPFKLNPIVREAKISGKLLASNPEIRKTIDELSLGFVLMKDHILNKSESEVMAWISKTAGDNQELYKILYTSFQQGKDLESALNGWLRSGGSREAFVKMLLKAESHLARLELIKARESVLKAGNVEVKTLQELEIITSKKEGNKFLTLLLKNPNGSKMLVGIIGAVGGSYLLKEMHNAWSDGNNQWELSDAAFTLIDFVPGGMSFKRAAIEGLDAKTVFSFVKEALYFSPAWPFVLVGDVAIISVDIHAAMHVQLSNSTLIDMLVYAGEYSKNDRFLRLKLPHKDAIEKDQLPPFFFGYSDPIIVPLSTKKWMFRLSNLRKISNEVLDHSFLESDTVTKQLRRAAEQQLDSIRETVSLEDFIQEQGGYFSGIFEYERWKNGFRTICQKSPTKWCRVFNLLEIKIIKRRDFVIKNIMIPYLIQEAEKKHALWESGNHPPIKELKEIQEKIEALRGKALGLDLVENVEKYAEEEVNNLKSLRETKEKQILKKGEYWRLAIKNYNFIYNEQAKLIKNMSKKLNLSKLDITKNILRFPWSGSYKKDAENSKNSLIGFALGERKLWKDIKRIKGDNPNPIEESIDRHAVNILAKVQFRWRMAMDSAGHTKKSVNESSKFTAEYKVAITKVEELYNKKNNFQDLINKNTLIKYDMLHLGEQTTFSLILSGEKLKKMQEKNLLNVKWHSKYGNFGSDGKGFKVNFSTRHLLPVKVEAIIWNRLSPELKVKLVVKVPVIVPQGIFHLTIQPNKPKSGELVRAEVVMPDYYINSYKFHYKWQSVMCNIDDYDYSYTVVTVPISGKCIVSVSISSEDEGGKTIQISSDKLSFEIQEKDINVTIQPKDGIKIETGKGSKGQETKGKTDKTDKNVEDGKGKIGKIKPEPSPETSKDTENDSWSPDKPVKENIGEKFKVKISGIPLFGVEPKTPTTLTMKVSGGEKPMIFKWEGENLKATEEKAIFYQESLGRYTVKAIVTDANGKSASAVVSILIGNSLTDALEKDVPSGLPMIWARYGQTGSYGLPYTPPPPQLVADTSDESHDDSDAGVIMISPTDEEVGSPVIYEKAEYTYIWHSNIQKGILFNPPIGKNTEVEVTFGNTGNFELWAEVLKNGKIFAETDHIKEDIILPKLRLEIIPKIPVVGENTKVIIHTDYNIDNKFIQFKWEPIGKNAQNFVVSPDQRSISFKPLNTMPIHLGVSAWTKSPYYGGKLGNKKYVVSAMPEGSGKLNVVLQSSTDTTCALGDTVKIVANISNGKEPYQYRWSGVTSKDSHAIFKCDKYGEYSIGLQVTDDKGNEAEDTLEIIVQAEKFEILGLPNKPIYDSSAKLSVHVSEGYKSTVKPIWIASEPGIVFDPVEGMKTTVTFGRIKKISIWVQVPQPDGGKTLESDQVHTEVISPKFILSMDSDKPFVGEEVRAKIKSSAKLSDGAIQWYWSSPPSSNRMEYNDPASEIGFRLKDTKLLKLEAEARVPHWNDVIGSVKGQIQAQEYKVIASPPKRLDKAPWKWDIKQGKAVELPQAIAVFQNAEVHCTITPKPKEKVRYKWTVDKKGCVITAPGSKSTNLNAHETETYTVLVKVSDKNGVALGEGSTTLTVTVSQRDLDVRKQKEDDQQKAKELLQEARKLWKEGKLQQAIAKAAHAQKIVGKDKAITKTLNAMQKQKKQLDDKLIKASGLIKQGKLDAAKKVLDSAAMISAKYEKYKEVLKQLSDAKKKAEEKKKQIAKLLKDAKALKDAGKLHEAVRVLKKGSKEFLGNKEISKMLKEVQKLQNDAQKKMKEGQKYWKVGLLEKAVLTLKKAAKIDVSNKQISKIMKGMQAQKKIMDNVLKQVGKLIEQKKFKQAKSLLKKAGRISKKYLPYIEMVKKIDSAKKKDEKLARELLKKAKDLWNTGSLDDAIAVLKKGSKQFTDNKKIKQALQKMQKDKKRVDGEISKAESLIEQKKITDAENSLRQAGKISKKYLPYMVAMSKLDIAKKKVEEEKKKQESARKKMTEGQAQWEKGLFDKAVSTLKEAAKTDPSNRQITKVLKTMQNRKKMIGDALKEADKLIGQKKFDHAQNALKKVERISGKYPPYIAIMTKLNFEKKKVEKERIVAEKLKQDKIKKEQIAKRVKEIKKKAAIREQERKIAREEAKKREEREKELLKIEEKKRAEEVKVKEELKQLEQLEQAKREQEELQELMKKIEAEEKREEDKKEKSVKKFMGTFSGFWKDKNGWADGSFKINIYENGKISGHYWGDDKGRLSGSVSSSGKLNMKSGGGSAGSGRWGGTIKINSHGKLQGNGTWNVQGYKGIWNGK